MNEPRPGQRGPGEREPVPIDPHLRQALRHAPDATLSAPPAVGAAILREARTAVQAGSPVATAPGRVAPPAPRGPAWAGWWQRLTRPRFATALASLALVTTLGLLWRDGLMDPPFDGGDAVSRDAAPAASAAQAAREPPGSPVALPDQAPVAAPRAALPSPGTAGQATAPPRAAAERPPAQAAPAAAPAPPPAAAAAEQPTSTEAAPLGLAAPPAAATADLAAQTAPPPGAMAKAEAAAAAPEPTRSRLARSPATGAPAPHSGSGLGLLTRQLAQEEGRWQARRDGGAAMPVGAELLAWLQALQLAVEGTPPPSDPSDGPATATWSIELLRDGSPQHLIAATSTGISWTPAAGGRRQWVLPASTPPPPTSARPTR